jgi:hypothetical protein
MQNEERINGLETQVQTLKRIVYGFGCLLVAGVVVSATSLQTVPDVIRAKRFEVVNGDGKVVVQLVATENGGVLVIANKDGTPLTAIFAGADGGGLGISNNEGKAVVGIYADADGGALGICNKDETPVVLISPNASGEGELKTWDNKGEITSQTP